jgi:NAD-dependent deacetylase
VAVIPTKLADALRATQHTVVLTGSGVSVDSGIPSFRDPQDGLWERFRPEDLATPEAFARDPALVWQWYQWRRELIGRVRPNAGHVALAALERLIPRLTLITQNVDGLHQRAGSRTVLEFHGNIHRNRCSVEQRLVEIDTRGTRKPPRCPSCGAPIRPDVVWFGETIPRAVLTAATLAASECDIYLAIGTSAVVQPAAALADLARQGGALLAEINPAVTPLSAHADFALHGSASTIVPELLALLH